KSKLKGIIYLFCLYIYFWCLFFMSKYLFFVAFHKFSNWDDSQRLMPSTHRHMSYEFSQKYFGTKLVPIERYCNPEHFDMHLETVHFMVLEILDSEVCVFNKK